jgi:hypothetical protein
MKSTFLKKLLCWTLALLCVLPLAAACTEQPDTQPDEPIDEPPEEQPDEQPTPQQPTDDEPPKEDFPMFDYVAFTDVDFSDLTNFKEAEGADSGARGSIYVIADKSFYKATGDVVLDYDITKFTASLQGLLNRKTPTLYVDDARESMNWFRFLRSFTDAPLYGMKRENIGSFDALLETFAAQIEKFGIVVWDPTVPATSNLATTVCGADGYLPVMYSDNAASLYQKLIAKFGADIVKMDLCGKFTGKGTVWETDRKSTGSAKCDAYVWAIENYLKAEKCDYAHIAYMTDFYPLSAKGSGSYLDKSVYETYLPSQDYIVAKGIFTFDLAMFSDHPATDDPEQRVGLDYEILKEILLFQYETNMGEFSQCIGFPPFPYKYTDQQGGMYDAVMAEWTTVEVMSAYNIAVVADCPGPSSLYNCSIYEKYEGQIEYSQAENRQNALENLPEYDKDTYYVFIYGGDYDAVSWTYHLAANEAWQDKKRGEIPIGWAFNPNLYERVPMLWDVFYHTATDNDFFIAGDSGAGYVNPMLLLKGKRKHSELPAGLDEWERWCKDWYDLLDITITGMILDGNTGYSHHNKEVLKTYAALSPDGIGVWNWPGNDSGMTICDGVAVSGVAQDSGFTRHDKVEAAAQNVVRFIQEGRKLNFYPIKTNIITPTMACQVMERAQAILDEQESGKTIKVVDPYTFFAMLERELTKK